MDKQAQSLPKAIFFDLDDTILAFSVVAEPCWRQVCQDFASRVPGVTATKLFRAIERSRSLFWRDPERHRRGRLDLEQARREIVAGALLELGVDALGLAEEISQTYAAMREEAIRPFLGAIETLRALREQGVRLALLTSGSAREQRQKIERFGLEPFFDLILIEGEFGLGKPDERVYLHALEKLGTTPAETWMVGDNLEWDVYAPQQLGIQGIWVDWSGRGLPEDSPIRPDRVVRAVAELVE